VHRKRILTQQTCNLERLGCLCSKTCRSRSPGSTWTPTISIRHSRSPAPIIIETRRPPPCPRYDAITAFLIANRSQNELCIDSIRFLIPERTLLEYILAYGGIDLTPEGRNAYLRLCDFRGKRFNYYQTCGLRGECEWIEKLNTSTKEGNMKGKYEGCLRAQKYPRPLV
jgi:hypothetical protein